MLVVHPQQLALYSRVGAACTAAWAPYPGVPSTPARCELQQLLCSSEQPADGVTSLSPVWELCCVMLLDVCLKLCVVLRDVQRPQSERRVSGTQTRRSGVQRWRPPPLVPAAATCTRC